MQYSRLMENKISREPFNFLLMGRSGCGKGTQAELLIKYLSGNNFGETLYVYTGNKIRDLVGKNDSLTAKLAKEIMLRGDIEPSFISVWSWCDDLVKNIKENNNLIMDGSPRMLSEAKMIDEAFDFYKRTNVKPIFIETSREWSTKRLLERGRVDDTEETIQHRLDFFDKAVIPAIDYYEKESKYKLVRVNGEQSIEDVNKEIIKKCFDTSS